MKTFLRTIGYFKNHKLWVAGLIVLAFFQSVGSIIEPIFFREIIDAFVNLGASQETAEVVYKILSLWIGVTIVVIIINITLTYYADLLAHRLFVYVWDNAIKRALSLSLSFHASKKAGSTMKRIERGADNIFNTQLDFLRNDLPKMFAFFVFIPLLFYLHWKMALIIVGFLPVLAGVAFWGNKQTREKQDAVEEKWTRASGFAFDAVANISIIKSFTAFKHKTKEINELIMKAHAEQVLVLKWWAFLIVLSKGVGMIANLLVFVAGTYFYLHNEITVGEIVMFLGFGMIILSNIEGLFWSFNQFLWKRGKLKQFFEIWDEIPEVQDKKNAKKMSKIKGNVEFKNVSFAHDKGKIYALKNVSFKVKKGETIALVGHTGSGKTTTVNLLSRFFDIQHGEILIDNINVADVTQNSLRKNIGMVFQENFLFHTSIRDNLIIGNTKASQKELEKACKTAEALGFIQKLPKKFETIVGERGVKLSGGEKQRVAIARALLKNPPILVLDEATSALDAETEQKIQKALEKLIKGRTTFIVAHRLSTIKKADKIIVFDKGKIKEVGNYKELMTQKGAFAKLVEAQVAGFVE